jgi:hypothetical protein
MNGMETLIYVVYDLIEMDQGFTCVWIWNKLCR